MIKFEGNELSLTNFAAGSNIDCRRLTEYHQ